MIKNILFIGLGGFSGSPVRRLLFAMHQVTKNVKTQDGLDYLKTGLTDYQTVRDKIINILEYIAALGRVSGMDHWQKDAEAAGLLAGEVRNDHVQLYCFFINVYGRQELCLIESHLIP